MAQDFGDVDSTVMNHQVIFALIVFIAFPATAIHPGKRAAQDSELADGSSPSSSSSSDSGSSPRYEKRVKGAGINAHQEDRVDHGASGRQPVLDEAKTEALESETTSYLPTLSAAKETALFPRSLLHLFEPLQVLKTNTRFYVFRVLAKRDQADHNGAAKWRKGDNLVIKMRTIDPKKMRSTALGALREPLTEVAYLNRVKHVPEILQPLDILYLKEDGRQVVVFPFMSGGDVFGNGPEAGIRWPERDALRVVRTLATTVGAMHRLGIGHRDITMENVLLQKPVPSAYAFAEVRLTDLEYAVVLQEQEASPLGGAFHVLSPERHARAYPGCSNFYFRDMKDRPATMDSKEWNDYYASHLAPDVYALGLLLFSLLTTKDAYQELGDLSHQEFTRSAAETLKRLGAIVSADTANLIQSMTYYDWAIRPSMDAVAATIDYILAAVDPAAVAPSPRSASIAHPDGPHALRSATPSSSSSSSSSPSSSSSSSGSTLSSSLSSLASSAHAGGGTNLKHKVMSLTNLRTTSLKKMAPC